MSRVDPAIQRLMVQARGYWTELRKGESNITVLAEREKLSPAYVTRVLRLAFLAMRVGDAFLHGRKRVGMTVGRLVATEAIDPNWAAQGRALVGTSS